MRGEHLSTDRYQISYVRTVARKFAGRSSLVKTPRTIGVRRQRHQVYTICLGCRVPVTVLFAHYLDSGDYLSTVEYALSN